MRWWLLVVLLVGCGAAKGPKVSKSDLALVPAEWSTTWEPHQQQVAEARTQVSEATSEVAEWDRAVRGAERDLSDIQREIRDAEKEQQAARKASDPEALGQATEHRSTLLAEQAAVERDLRIKRAGLRYAQAVHDRLDAEREVAERRLELVRAQGVRDAGGWIEIDRFAEALTAAEARVAQAEEQEQTARSAKVLAEQ